MSAAPGAPAHHGPDGRFRNVHLPDPSDGRGRFAVLRWLAGLGPLEAPAVDPALVPAYVPAVVAPDLGRIGRPDPARVQITWIGHATFLIQAGGVNILTDPHWSDRASPVPFAGPRRLAPPGVRFRDLPRIDLVLISHNHYDHLDLPTVRRLARLADPPRWLVPLGLREWFVRAGVAGVTEHDWWDRVECSGLRCTATPAQHFSRRTLTDGFRTLWCGWVVETGRDRIYFAGDTGYSPHGREIGERLGPFAAALLPIGAYMPRWFMRPMHMNPEEAVAMHRDLRSRRSLAMHWGTFRLTDESPAEPPVFLRQVLAREGLPEGVFTAPRIGETVVLAD